MNTRDASSCAPSGTSNTFYPCQGNLRQFIINANALGGEGSLTQAGSGQLDGSTTALPSGFESSIFMIPSAALTSGVATITLASALPTVTGSSTRLDATTQTVNIGNTNSGTARHRRLGRRRQRLAADLPAAGSATQLRGERRPRSR